MGLSNFSNLQQRIIAGLTGAILLVSGVLLSEWTYFILFFSICLLSLIEYYKLLKMAGVRANNGFGIFGGIVIYVLIFLMERKLLDFSFFYLLFPFLFILFIIELFKKQESPFSTIAFTFLGVIYIAIPFGLLNVSAYYLGEYSSPVVLGILLLLWGNDVGGYIGGVTMGKHKLFLRISPKKTWEGAAGGAVLSFAAAIGISFIFPELPLHHWLALSVIIVILGSYGDLVESMLKRSLSIKDSGSTIPGHGGFLDRFDGLLLASPFIAAYLKIFG